MRALGGGVGGRAAMRIGKEGGRSHTADARQVRTKHCGNATSILRLMASGGGRRRRPMGGQESKTPLKKTLEEITIAIQTQLGVLDATGKTQRGRKRQPQIYAGSSLCGNAQALHP